MNKQYEEYVNKRVSGLWKNLKLSLLPTEYWQLAKVSVVIEIYLIEYQNGIADVPIGTKHEPFGISILRDSFVAFVDVEAQQITEPVHVDVLKDYIRKNYERLNKTMVEKYKHLAVQVDVEGFTSFYSPLNETSP
jgi:hypothetical protein